MIRQILVGTTAALLMSGPVSALTMTPTSDNRMIQAHAIAGIDDALQSSTPGSAYPPYNDAVSAQAMEFGLPGLLAGDPEFVSIGGASAYANASQTSSIGPLSISGSGYADASGNHGDIFRQVTLEDNDALPVYGHFQAYGESVLEVMFSIDQAASFDLTGFLSAGVQLTLEDAENTVVNRASISLTNADTLESAYTAEISNDILNVNESGVIAAGNYVFNVHAYAEVMGGFTDVVDFVGDQEIVPNGFGYGTAADFSNVHLQLSATDKPIPEPVTTSLVGMSLGALVLGATRRRKI